MGESQNFVVIETETQCLIYERPNFTVYDGAVAIGRPASMFRPPNRLTGFDILWYFIMSVLKLWRWYACRPSAVIV